VDGSPPGRATDYRPEQNGVAGDKKEEKQMTGRDGERQVERGQIDGGAMMRQIFWKAMMVGRTAALTLGVAVMLALVLGAGTTAVAATGGNFLLGKANSARTVSKLTSGIAGPTLQLISKGTTAAATALNLKVAPGRAPLTVNADAGTATNLSADRLDGKDSTEFQQANATAGGDLSGSYPNPQLAQGAVGPDEVANWSLGIEDVTKSAGFASLDPGPVPASGCIDVSVAGASVAQWDFMLVNPPSSLPDGLVASPMMANSNGPFTFRLCNMKSTSIDPPAGVWGIATFDTT
jgi:hypothetical protein